MSNTVAYFDNWFDSYPSRKFKKYPLVAHNFQTQWFTLTADLTNYPSRKYKKKSLNCHGCQTQQFTSTADLTSIPIGNIKVTL